MGKQCYLLPLIRTDDGIEVLIGQKALEQTRVDFKPVRPSGKNIRDRKATGTGMIPNNAGQWVIIGGGQDKDGEESAAYREFYEETGVDLKIRPGVISAKSRLINALWHCELAIFSGQHLVEEINKNIDEGRAPDDELTGVQWFDIETAITLMKHDYPVREPYTARAYKPRDWFVEMLYQVRDRARDLI